MTIGEKVIEKLIKEEGKDIKMAFMPHKYSMWDCMESVYKAAIGSGLWADICPLTYQILPEGTYINESGDFKKAGYKTIEFSTFREEKYDIIVIHYPYDGFNNVTKLLVYEWTDALKKYGKIMYIPYHGNIAGREWSRFFTMPGARQSDYIVLGSQMDVEVFLSVNIGYQGKVIQVENSPKSDAPWIHEKDALPEEWKDLKRPISVICGTLWTFTNSPIDRMQKHGAIVEQELSNGRSVIYRPHPLVRNAIKVMRPEIVKAYDDFLEELIAMGVIIDDGPDLHKTLAAADYLFIDPSSVIRTVDGRKPYEVIE